MTQGRALRRRARAPNGPRWRSSTGSAVVEASGPLLRLTSIGAIELAPTDELLRRVIHRAGRVAGNCYDGCTLRTTAPDSPWPTPPTAASAATTTSGAGSSTAPSQLLVPAVLVPGNGSDPSNNRDISYAGVLAISSALLVDDLAQAGAARQADARSADLTASGPGCAAAPPEWPVIAVALRSRNSPPVFRCC